MRVLFDFQVFDWQKIGGISRYFYQLMSEFEKDLTIDWDLSMAYSSNLYLKSLEKFKSIEDKSSTEFIPGVEFIGKGFLHRTKNKVITPADVKESEKNKLESIRKIKEGNFDVFHPTYYDDYFLDHLGAKPFVLTVHDCIHQVFPEFIVGTDKLDKSQLLLDKAARIIAISESTKRDLVNLFTIDENKIDVVYLANSLTTSNDKIENTFGFELPEKYFLFVGGRDDYKNFLFFIQVFSALAKLDDTINVVCTGPKFTGTELHLIKKLGLEGRIYRSFVDDGQLSYLYKNAVAFIYPTMYEGFGLPVLEAFYNGCPAVISRTSSLTEISGDAAILFEPKVPVSMLSALKTVLYNEGFRKEKIAAGLEQERKFSWEKTALQTKECYQRALNKR